MCQLLYKQRRLSKLKAFTKSELNMVRIMGFLFDWGGGGNIIGKGENAGNHHVLFPLNVFKISSSGYLTQSLIHHFETVPNSKKQQTTTEMWLVKDFKIQIELKTLW